MSAVIKETSLYERLLALPENLVGEIVNGELYIQPRPAGPHASTSSVLGMDIGSAYHRGRGGPGGWWIIFEPELHFVRDTEVLVPDLAGWRRERMPSIPQDHRFEVVPDWVCEVLSPGTQSKDRVLKMKAYAHYGVAFLWLADPLARILETYALANGQWIVAGLYQGQDEVCAAPFDAITLALGRALDQPLFVPPPAPRPQLSRRAPVRRVRRWPQDRDPGAPSRSGNCWTRPKISAALPSANISARCGGWPGSFRKLPD